MPATYVPPLTSSRFYAPWCGHCKNLKPTYEKAAKNLAGLAKVAALDCDEEENKPLCGQMGIKGFPTLKTVTPGSRPGKPRVEEYQGGRTAKAIVDAVVDKIPNHVKKLQDKDVDDWLSKSNDSAKAVLFTDKGATSALLRALAIDFLGSISVAQIRQKETSAVATFNIDKFPSLVLLPGGKKESLLYDGELKKDALVKFFSQVAAPNPEHAQKQPKAAKSKTVKPPKAASSSSASSSSAFSEASASQKSQEAADPAASASTIVLENFEAFESADPMVSQEEQPLVVTDDDIPPLKSLFTEPELRAACLGLTTGTCVLALLPDRTAPGKGMPTRSVVTIESFARVAHKFAKRDASIFPFYAVPADNEATADLRNALGLKPKVQLDVIAVNAKRRWWRHFVGDGSIKSVEAFIDDIKLGGGKRQVLPSGLIEDRKKREEEHDEL